MPNSRLSVGRSPGNVLPHPAVAALRKLVEGKSIDLTKAKAFIQVLTNAPKSVQRALLSIYGNDLFEITP